MVEYVNIRLNTDTKEKLELVKSHLILNLNTEIKNIGDAVKELVDEYIRINKIKTGSDRNV